MDLGLRNRVALVAGGSSGLGLAVARELAAEGAHVSLSARDPARLEAARTEVEASGDGRVLAVPVDVTDESAIRRWVARTVDEFGSLGIVIANAGGSPAGYATEFILDDYRRALELNLLSSIALVQTALPHLRDGGWGRILFITSQAVRQPMPNLALSSTARVGLLGYTRSLVEDLARLGETGITVNVLAPGSTRTARLEELAGNDVEAGLERMALEIALGRIAEPAEFAAAAVFLASARASFITGVTLPVDGGWIGGLP